MTRWMHMVRLVEVLVVSSACLAGALVVGGGTAGLFVLFLALYGLLGWHFDNGCWPWRSYAAWRRQRLATAIWRAAWQQVPEIRRQRCWIRQRQVLSAMLTHVQQQSAALRELEDCICQVRNSVERLRTNMATN